MPGLPAWRVTCSAPEHSRLLCATGVAGFLYNSSRGSTYLFSTSDATFSSAEQSCKDQGGHLASWAVEQEQVGRGCRHQAPRAHMYHGACNAHAVMFCMAILWCAQWADTAACGVCLLLPRHALKQQQHSRCMAIASCQHAAAAVP